MIRRRDFITLLGGAAAWPLAARAQQPRLPVIGYLSSNQESDESGDNGAVAAFRRGIGEQGYVEGRNVEILYRYAENQYDHLPELAADLVRRRVAVIFCFGTLASLAAKKATATIPIVFSTGADPVDAGLVASLNRPGGNVTGTAYLVVELAAKRLELLHEIAPAAKSIGYLHFPGFAAADDPAITGVVETAARTLGVRLVTASASSASKIERAFAVLVGEGSGAVLLGVSVASVITPRQIVALAAHYALPAMYPNRDFVEAGGLISYKGNTLDAARIAGNYVGQILKGEHPADLPVQQPTKFELLINMKTAKTLGLTVPPTLLAFADEVIE
jgi:putative ABC transport system substrate-binding protein